MCFSILMYSLCTASLKIHPPRPRAKYELLETPLYLSIDKIVLSDRQG